MIALPDRRIAAPIAQSPGLAVQTRLLAAVPGAAPPVPATLPGPALPVRVLGVRS